MAIGPLNRLLQHLRRSARPQAGGATDAQLLDHFLRQRDEAAFNQFLDDHIYGVKEFAEYLELCGGLRRLQQLRRRELLLHLGR